MSFQSKWIYRKSDGVFLRGGILDTDPQFNSATEDVVIFTDESSPHPDVIRERFDATSASFRRAATQVEIEAMVQVARDADVDQNKMLRALARASWEIADAVPKPTFQQFMDRIKAIYRAL